MKSLLILPLCLIASSSSCAEIIPVPGTQSVTNLFRASDIVCSCIVQSISSTHDEAALRGNEQPRRRPGTAVVRVQEVFKGDSAAGSLLNVDYGSESQAGQPSSPSLAESEIAVLFLKKSGSGYVVADPFMGVTRLSQIPFAGGGEGILRLQSALLAIIKASDQASAVKALTLIEGMDEFSQEAKSEMLELSRSNDADLALTALAVLVKAEPSEGSSRLVSFLNEYTGDGQHVALQTLSVELMHIVDPTAVPALESLSSSKFISIRFGSMLGLRSIRDPRSTAALARRLDDPDSDIRFIAVMTLAEMYQKSGDFAPSSPAFDSNPRRYTDLWRGWLLDPANKAELNITNGNP